MTKKNQITEKLTLGDVTRVHIEILQSAIKAQHLNQAFFWAASEMVTPAVNLKGSFNLNTPFFDILFSDKIGKSSDATKFIHAMEKSYELGTGSIEDALRTSISDLMGRIHKVYPSYRGMAA